MENNSVSACTVSGDYIVYKTTCMINKKIYVGKHYSLSVGRGIYFGSGKLITYALKKYGRENFIRETLDYCTSANIFQREIYWIAELSATDRNIGYNITSGGETPPSYKGKDHYAYGTKLTEEHKKKLSDAKKGKPSPRKGSKHTEETKIKLSLINLNRSDEVKKKILDNIPRGKSHPFFGKKRSEETKLKIKNSLMGHEVSEETRRKFSRPLSEEHKRKISESCKGRKHSEESKRKISESSKGKPKSEEHRKNIIKSLIRRNIRR